MTSEKVKKFLEDGSWSDDEIEILNAFARGRPWESELYVQLHNQKMGDSGFPEYTAEEMRDDCVSKATAFLKSLITLQPTEPNSDDVLWSRKSPLLWRDYWTHPDFRRNGFRKDHERIIDHLRKHRPKLP